MPSHRLRQHQRADHHDRRARRGLAPRLTWEAVIRCVTLLTVPPRRRATRGRLARRSLTTPPRGIDSCALAIDPRRRRGHAARRSSADVLRVTGLARS
jgi:hypothetical protein